MQDTLTKAERSLRAAGQGEFVMETRSRFHRTQPNKPLAFGDGGENLAARLHPPSKQGENHAHDSLDRHRPFAAVRRRLRLQPTRPAALARIAPLPTHGSGARPTRGSPRPLRAP